MPSWLQIVVGLLPVVALLCGAGLFLYNAGANHMAAKNGYVRKENCELAMRKIETELTLIHEKVNGAKEGIANVQGTLDQMNRNSNRRG